MYSIKFPNMLSSTAANLAQDREATLQNLVLLLGSEKGELFGDLFFGANLKQLIYDQNNAILKDIVIDNIYTVIIMFMPQIAIKRKDISLRIKNNSLFVDIKCYNMLTAQIDLYSIPLTESENL